MTTNEPLAITGLHTYMQRVGNRPRLLVRIDTDAGISGWGEAYNHGPDRALPPLLDYLFDIIKGADARRVEHISAVLIRSTRFPPGALGLAAIAAIDHALWDIAGKAANLPVYMLLGGNVRDRVPVYCGLYDAPDPDECLDRAQAMHEAFGFTAFKLSPYRRQPHDTRWGTLCREVADYFGELRSRAPQDWEFAFDAHAKVFEPIRALQLADALAPFDPLFLEEPLRPEHIPAWGRLRAQMRIPLATGESLYSPYEFLALLSAGGVDIAQPDICVVGGLTQMRKIATIADAHYVPIAPHNPMGPLATAHNVHFAAATTNFAYLEYKPDTTTWCPDPYLPTDGHLDLRPDRPGWGVEIDEEALAHDDYVHWERRLPVRPDGSVAFV
ncbi:mandelate racemase/muconate lactonizing enzyme family protein [Cellulomonas timonensis]|uniref:mandelate racemase/muconate lactonizing enzyme family protein n=1 Tax=Cellulomonas timonensis TaxID=1689271 RepID=UPI000B264D9D|nr:mandelate racemase/muconate lactonizing enzyme family protein [Cellulomonas timonensis]